MSIRLRSRGSIPWFFFLLASLAAGETVTTQSLERQFQAAVAQYNAGHFVEAAAQLEAILPHLPNSFEIQELLGLVYSAESQDAKATQHLEIAVKLKPDSAAARTSLATNLLHVGKIPEAEAQFKKAVTLDPSDFDANHNLGEFYIQSGKLAEAAPFLERAQRIKPAYDNGYDLALAYLLSGSPAQSKPVAQSLLQLRDTAELHNLLAQIAEKSGEFVEAANQYEMAAHMDPTESNLFDWASELLVHRTYDPAITVFQEATQRYSNSSRLWIGYGMSLYSRGEYDQAVTALLRAADLNPGDPRSYLFLSRAFDSSPNQADAVIERFRRFAELQPNNALADYYYAMSLWKGNRAGNDSSMDVHPIESLLRQSAALDPKLPDPHVQLGNLYFDQHEYAKSSTEYELALKLDDKLADAHYRLGQDYVRLGQKDRAQIEFAAYQRIHDQSMAQLDKERTEVRQFVYSEKTGSVAKQ